MKNVPAWLRDIGLQKYVEVFLENDIDSQVLFLLTDADLKELGLSVGHRKRFRIALELLQKNLPVFSSQPPAQIEELDSSSVPERRFMSLMFCDLVDSIRLTNALDAEDMHAVNRAYQNKCTHIIQRNSGYIAGYMGDGILAYFGYPSAKEDDAERAVNAGLEITRAVNALNSEFSLPDKLELLVRVGVASGSVVVEAKEIGGTRENVVVGEAPNLAARLQGLASVNTVMIGPDTNRLIGDAFELKDCGRKAVKGYTEEMPTWQVVGSRSLDERLAVKSGKYLTSFIGREEEYNLLRSRWQRSVNGSGQVVLLSGEAGIGKSRLVDALLQGINGPHYKTRLFCAPHNAQNPLHPFINHLLREVSVDASASTTEKREKMSAHLSSTYQFDNATLQSFVSLAFLDHDLTPEQPSADPQHVMQLLQEKMVDRIVQQSQTRPILLVIEDAHWIDASSQKVMDMLAERIYSQRIMMLVNFRNEKTIKYSSSNVTNLSLSNLSKEDALKLIHELADAHDLPDETMEKISEKTAGIPLLLEELTKSIVVNDAKAGNTGGDRVSVVPDTLQASLLSVLDRLGNAKLLAQMGSVVGNAFGRDVLLNICKEPKEEIDLGLDELVSTQVTVRESSGENSVLRFRHALLRDAAYESLLKVNRVEIHAMIAEYLGKSQARDERSSGSIIAYHYEMARLTDKAFISWLRAGESAFDAGATTEAAELLNKAYLLLPKISAETVSREELYLFHMYRGRALNASVGAIDNEVHESFSKAAAIARELENVNHEVDALDYLFGVTFNAGAIRESIKFANQMLDLGTTKDNAIATISGHQGLGMAYCTLGEFDDARLHLEAALAFKDKNITGINCYPSMTLDYLSYVEYITGQDEVAEDYCQKAILSARKESDYATATALSNSCFTQMMLGNKDKARDYSKQALDLAKSRGQLMVLSRALLFHNLAMAWIERSPAYLTKVVESTDKLFQSGEVIDLTYLIGMTAELQINMGLLDDAATSLERALSLSAENEENFYRVELLRLKSDLVNMPGFDTSPTDAHKDATALLDQAAALAARQGAKGWQRRVDNSRQH